MVTQLSLQGRRAWLKTYERGDRRLRLRMLDLAARRLGVPALRPPPHPGGDAARAVERRRLTELAALQVRVPEVLGESGQVLLLSDIGETLASRLRVAGPDDRRRLVLAAARALAEVHARSGCIGQPLARNIAVDEAGRIGFLDFEEDPREVMPLEQAQVRDWLVFAAGVSRYFDAPERELADILIEALRDAAPPVRMGVGQAGERLGVVARIAGRLGERARRIAGAILALRSAALGGLLALACLGLAWDYAGDRQLDAVQHVVDYLD